MITCKFFLPYPSAHVHEIATDHIPNANDVVTLALFDITEGSTNTFKVHNIRRIYTDSGLRAAEVFLADWRPGE
jgi:hypothetical protein